MKLKSTMVLASASVVLLGVGTASLFTVVSAEGQNGSNTPIYSRIAAKLGIEEETYCSAVKSAEIDDINDRVAAGTLDSTRAEEIKANIEDSDCGRPRMARHREMPQEHTQELAEFLGVSVEELDQAKKDGKTLEQLAKENGKSLDEFKQTHRPRGPDQERFQAKEAETT